MKLATYDGGVWKFADNRYKALIKEVANGRHPHMDAYGTYLGHIAFDVTEITQEEACRILEHLR